MDRLGEDLTELILSYLTFEDKVRLECTAKQWRRTIFNKQYFIEINDSYTYIGYPGENNLIKLFKELCDGKLMIRLRNLESLLKKCPNLCAFSTDQELGIKLLELINKYCPRLKELEVKEVSDECLEPSLWKFGQHLESLKACVGSDQQTKDKLEKLLGSFNKLELLEFSEINAMNIWYPKIKDKKFLPKLEFISNFEFNPKTMDTFKMLADKYSKTLKTMHVLVKSKAKLKTLFRLIGRFENLIHLMLCDGNYVDADSEEEEEDSISPDIDIYKFSEQIREMFRKLSKLKFLSINGAIVGKNFVNSLSECGSLVKLVIESAANFSYDFDIQEFPVLPKL